MIESFVDLTYRGLSVGRRVKLAQVRPSSGYLELSIPMPVGTHLAITTDEGVTFDATVSWVNEQVAGADRTPGMVVVPAIAADPASSWWKARIALPDEDKPAPRSPRSRSVTLRPRTHTEPAPPPEGAITDELPAMATDLHARVAAAAGVEPPKLAGAHDDRRTTAMDPVHQEVLQQLTRSPDGEAVVRRGEHAVVDDGKQTAVMAALEGSDLGASEDPDASEADAAGDGGEASDDGEPGAPGGGDQPSAGGRRERRKR